MPNKDPASSLRQKAEEIARSNATQSLQDQEALLPTEMRRTFHELQVHQIELEMQNEELRRAQEELDAARARYFDLYDLAPVGYCTLSEKGLILEANLTAATRLGVTRHELVKQPISRFILKDDQDIYYRHREQLFKTGAPQACELRMVGKDGTIFWARLDATVVQDTHGEPVCRVVLSDITERKQYEEVQTFLAQTSSRPDREPFFNALARYLAQSLGMAFVCIDRLEGDGLTARTVAVWCDGHFEDNVTYALKDTPCGDVVGKTICCFPASVCQFFPRDQVLQELRAESYVGVTLWSHTGQPIGLIAVIGRGPLVNRRWAEATLKLVAVRAAGELECQQAEDALRASEHRFRSYFDLPLIGIAITSPEKGWLEVNDQLCDTLGYSREQLLGMTWTELTHPEDVAADLANFNRVLAGELDGYRLEKRFIRADGRVMISELVVRCVRKPEGEVEYFVALVHDITERKLLESKLQQAQKMEAVGQLAGGVAHDFNNILAATMMNLNLLEQDANLTVEMRESIKELARDAKRAASLTRQLLIFSRRHIVQQKVLDWNEILDHLLKMLRRLLGDHIDLVLRVGNTPLWIEADPGMMEQVVMNLCVNARDAMPKGGRLILSTQRVAVDAEHAKRISEARVGGYALLAVQDEGCGMDEETLKKIFEPFFTTKEVGKGTGLGLATVYGIVKQHHGWVEVESQVGKGTEFRVYLPIANKEAETPSAESGQAQMVGGSETILLVEDDPSVRRTTAAFLKQLGYTVWEAGNGVEASRLWKQHRDRICLLFTDMVMPEGMTGLDLAEQLRAQKPGLAVIITSGYSLELLGQGGQTTTGITYVPKPCDPDALARTLRECLRQEGDKNP